MRLTIVAPPLSRRAVTLLLAVFTALAASVSAAPSPSLADRARTALHDALVREKLFVKVHAAEALIALGDRETPRRVFLAELPAAADQRPYRIGVWRVLAVSAPDRIHAADSLGKLSPVPAAPPTTTG